MPDFPQRLFSIARQARIALLVICPVTILVMLLVKGRDVITAAEAHVALLTLLSNVVLAVITGVYVALTARTLNLMRESRIIDFKPILCFTDPTLVVEGTTRAFNVRITNFGRGHAIAFALQSSTFDKINGVAQWVGCYHTSLAEKVIKTETGIEISISVNNLVIPTSSFADAPECIRLRITFEDAMRNLYAQQIGYAVYDIEGKLHPMLRREGVWRKDASKRNFVYETKGRFEHNVEPEFYRSHPASEKESSQ